VITMMVMTAAAARIGNGRQLPRCPSDVGCYAKTTYHCAPILDCTWVFSARLGASPSPVCEDEMVVVSARLLQQVPQLMPGTVCV
jgi:hypothetical protein